MDDEVKIAAERRFSELLDALLSGTIKKTVFRAGMTDLINDIHYAREYKVPMRVRESPKKDVTK